MKNVFVFISGLVLFAGLFTANQAQAQRKKKKPVEKIVRIYDIDTLSKPIPNNRASFHIAIDRELKRADASDGAVDNFIYYSEDTAFSNLLTNTVLKGTKQMQVMIENMPDMSADKNADNQNRVRYLRMLAGLIRRYNADSRVDPVYYKKLYSNFKEMLIARHENRLMEFVQNNVNIYSLANAEVMDGYNDVRAFIYSEMGKQEPEMMIKKLSDFANEPFACDIIAAAAKVVPKEVYNYVSSSNYTLTNAIKKCQDPLVQTIVRINAQSKSPLKAMSFLSDIHNKVKTIAQIDEITASPELFYKNLVRLKLNNETLGGDTYTDELMYRGLKFVRTMNDLHEEKDPVRFKCIDGFTPDELYFLMVYGQDEIYTSSFLGTFRRMMERMKPMKGNELFEKVHYDRFRTFIRMCAGYNTLDTFFTTIDPEAKNQLLRDFIAGLEKGKENELEDAVDVADAFGSIHDATLKDFLMTEVKSNYQRCSDANSKKGIIVYGLLSTLFSGNAAEIGLPPIDMIQYKNMVSDSGIVYEQFFFYGDKDGKSSYDNFLTNFKDKTKWKSTLDKNWITIRSITGKPIVVYANLPIPEPGDEEAQNQLVKYLQEKGIEPTFVVHRGHSYHLSLTLDRLTKGSKLVMLGSCGGYHNIAVVLDRSPDAHIISTKQTGTMFNNEMIIKEINDRLLAGEDLNWIDIWSKLEGNFTGKNAALESTFKEYVPPNKNLGAIFIKAYRKMSNSMEL